MSEAYVVEVEWDYEGSSVQTVTTSRLQAFACADAIDYGDIIEVSRWVIGTCIERWQRRRGEIGYRHLMGDGTTPWREQP